MSWMFPSLVATITCILALVYCYLYFQYHERYMGFWALSWGIYSLKNIVELLMLAYSESMFLVITSQLSFLLICLFFLWGVYAFMGRPTPKWSLYGAAVCLSWITAGLLLKLSYFMLILPMLEFIAAIYLWMGVSFLRFRGIEGAGKYIIGWAFIVWGIHTGDYPFLREAVWFAPWGYLAGEALKMILALGIIMVYLQKNVKDRDDLHYLNVLIENMNEVFLTYDTGARITFANRKCWETLGYKPEELVGRLVFDLAATGESRERIRKGVRAGLEKGDPVSNEISVCHKDGGTRFIRINLSSIVTEDKITGGMMLAEDITGRKEVEQELNLQKACFQQLFVNSSEGVVMLDNSDRIIGASSGFERLFQYTLEEVRGRYVNEVLVPDHLLEQAAALSNAVLNGMNIQKESVRMRKDRSLVDVSIQAYPIVFNDRQVGTCAIYSDITDSKRVEEQLKYLSLYDPLTGIYNRAYFEQEMSRLEAGRKFPVSIMVCDVDGLKLVNDTLGHNFGDELLVSAAGLIRESFRAGDVVARIGGDEFAVLLPSSRTAVENACSRIQGAVAGYNQSNPHLPLSISIGFATSDGLQASLADLFKEADNNMYREKLHRSQSVRSAIVQTLMKALEARDYITEGHGDRLKGLAEGLARAVGLSERNITDLRLLAQFHDIGKVGIPDRILFKNGPLTQAEFTEMQRHSEIGHRIAQSAPDLVPIADWILKHHEWWNGEGYPLRLRGEEIPLECRILAIADAYDAMTNNRPYRKAMTPEDAVDEIRRCSGTQFDPGLVSIFIHEIKTSWVQGSVINQQVSVP